MFFLNICVVILSIMVVPCFAASLDATGPVENPEPAQVVSEGAAQQDQTSLAQIVQQADNNTDQQQDNPGAQAEQPHDQPAPEQQAATEPAHENQSPSEAPQPAAQEQPAIVHHMEAVVEQAEVPAEKPVEQPVAPHDASDFSEEGIDTLDVQGGGNWLLKRGWWEQAEKRYEKIKALMNQVMDARLAFFAKRAELDRNVLDPFYTQIGLDQGRIEETITYLLDEMEQEKKKDVTLTEEERSFVDVLALQKKTLEQLMLDVQAISKLDRSIDETIATLNDQVDRARGYENQAWKNFKDISRELSDEKAKELYYAIDTFYANAGDILHYIQNDLGQHFNQLIDIGVKQIETIKNTMQSLKEKGVDLKRQAQRIVEQEESAEKGQSAQEEKLAREREAKKAQENRGFFGFIWDYIAGFFSAIGSFFVGIFQGIVNFFKKLF